MLVKNLVKQGQHLGSYDSGIVWFEKLEKFENLKIRNSSLVMNVCFYGEKQQRPRNLKFEFRALRFPFAPGFFMDFVLK